MTLKNVFSSSSKSRKVFVLDTNVILHDSTCIYQFDEHDVVLPITVLEELDRFKKGKDIINCNSREFIRALDTLTGDESLSETIEKLEEIVTKLEAVLEAIPC